MVKIFVNRLKKFFVDRFLWKSPEKKFFEDLFFGDRLKKILKTFSWSTLAFVYLVLGLGLEHSCPWASRVFAFGRASERGEQGENDPGAHGV